MNERIRELKIKACKWASENVSATEYENACDKKFAELIIRECANIAAEQSAIKPEYRIRKHFGVEE